MKRLGLSLALSVSISSALAAPPVTAAPLDDPAIVVTGTRSAYVDFRLTRKVTPDPSLMTVTTDGTYAGYVITEKQGEMIALVGGGLVIPRFVEEAEKASDFPFDPMTMSGETLDPGVYRMRLITDGTTTVRIPAQGLKRDLVLRPDRPAAEQTAELDDLGSGPGELEGRTSIRRSRNTLTLAAVLSVVENHQGSTIEQCLKRRAEAEDECDPTTDFGATWAVASPGSVGSGWILSWSIFSPIYGAGPHTVIQGVRQVATSSQNLTFVLNLHLTAPKSDNYGPAAPDETFSFPYQVAGVQGNPLCAAWAAGVVVGSCWRIPARPTDHSAKVKIVDAAGGPTAATVTSSGKTYEICGETEKRIPVDPGGGVFVDVHAHPTAGCPMGRGTTGSVEVTLSADRP